MSTYNLTFDQIRQDPKLGAVLTALERGFYQFDIDFYLVGAVSRDLWMSGVHQIRPRRTTGDIDFAIRINDHGRFEALRQYLTETEDFHGRHDNAFVLIHSSGMHVDLMPFGAIEDQGRRVTVQGTGYTTIDVEGFREVYEHALPEVDLSGHTFKFCTLPGIVLLKFIAWEDRPEVRSDDIRDISDILKHYYNMADQEIWDHHYDIFAEEGAAQIDELHIAARVLGRELKTIAQRNAQLLARITALLQRNTADPETCAIGRIMTTYFDNTLEDNLHTLHAIRKGFEEGIKHTS